jgi:hypothetical protein
MLASCVSLVVLRKCARRTGNEAEREPLPALVDSCAEVAAVLALCRDVFVALKDGGECVCAASEDERHVGGCCGVAKLGSEVTRCFAKVR